ncbi:hypothetical protein [Aeoliella mucimassa]|uniref:hypothetical protein n=1 Tax=Aeoliella mucimassa TaxID=2527972 RepID=UPI0018D4C13F|nr:hypothetical protein [Aeoliella mucimassa]
MDLLADMKELNTVDLDDTPLTYDDIERLKERRPDLVVHYTFKDPKIGEMIEELLNRHGN